MAIIDVSTWQGAIDWPRTGVAGVTCVMVRCAIGDRWVDDRFRTNWKGAQRIPRRGIYSDLITGQSGAAQALNIFHQSGADFGTEPVALDVERTSEERTKESAGWVFPKAEYTAMLWDVVSALQSAGARVEIYTSKIEWEAMTTQPDWAIPLRHWVAHYNDHIAAPDVPAGWEWDLWQYGQAPVDGIAEPVDVSRERSVSVTVSQGVLIGAHTEINSNIIPIALALQSAGAVLPIMCSVEDPGKCVDGAKAGVKTRVFRFKNKRGPDNGNWYEGGGSGRLDWSSFQEQQFVTTTVDQYLAHTNPTERAQITHVQPGLNEWDGQTPQEWTATGKLLCRVCDEWTARLPGVRLALPIFNAGTPKTVAMYDSLVATGLFKKMHLRHDLIAGHEGIGPDQPFDFLDDGGPNDQGVRGHNTLDGNIYLPDAGLLNFRLDYLMSRLGPDEICDYATLEWYDGRRRSTDPDQILIRINNLIRLDQHMALLGGPWRKFYKGLCVYELTNDPSSSWWWQDFTPILSDLRWVAYCVSVKDRVNGENPMPNISQPDFAALVASNQTDAAILAKYQPVHTWVVGDVALAAVNPLVTYVAPNGAVHDLRPPTPPGGPMITYPLNVIGVTTDQLWLQVAPTPLWVKVADVKLK